MINLVAHHYLSFSKNYVLGTDGEIYRLPMEGKGGRFWGFKKLKPLYTGRNKKSIGWSIVMPDGDRKLWYKAQIEQYFLKLEKPIIIKQIK